ncbi:hypothetical protein [Micromonospora carbonacea]|uniref:Uncharacterized protein n=1 Tax=Micromonospora carbonacea TaxID=47853 RepID=A0A7H8XD48_9ACTN|nr:hypothetical protein [Micromonospora carbonacea]MBB5830058.1 hypothetical protein [Micromonospora carbonacea]QLD22825.1 hypothetical protein HXZ27_30545 [Micromonospora carbonacea]
MALTAHGGRVRESTVRRAQRAEVALGALLGIMLIGLAALIGRLPSLRLLSELIAFQASTIDRRSQIIDLVLVLPVNHIYMSAVFTLPGGRRHRPVVESIRLQPARAP